SIAFTWLQEQTLKFEWTFTQPITVTARIKEDQNTWTVLQIVNVKNKYIPYENISISHPEIRDKEKSKEEKKYTYRSLNQKEDENTKRYYGDDHYIRSTADSGGQQLARGLEHQMLHEIKAQGEIQDFINVLKVLEQYPEVKAIRAFTDVLPESVGHRKYTKLS